MKVNRLAFATLLAVFGWVSVGEGVVQAESTVASEVTPLEVLAEEEGNLLLAQFNINVPGVDIEVGGDDDDGETMEAADDDDDAAETSSADDGEIFSGDVEPYLDDYNGFALDIPVEFPLNDAGQTTDRG